MTPNKFSEETMQQVNKHIIDGRESSMSLNDLLMPWQEWTLAMYNEIRSLQQQVNILQQEKEELTDKWNAACHKWRDRAAQAEQQVNTLTEALRSCVWELQQWVKSFHPDAHDEGKKIAHKVIEKSYKALQSIKDTPREEQGK